jgi:hypothetical protein
VYDGLLCSYVPVNSEPSKMLELINNLLSKNPALRDLTIFAMFALSLYQSVKTERAIEKTAYQYEYHILSYSLADVNTNEEISTMVRKWQDEGWGAQIAAAQVICVSPARDRIVKLLGETGTSTLCRISH